MAVETDANPDELRRDPDKVYKGRDVTLPSTGRRYHYRERWDYEMATQIQMKCQT